MRELRIDEVEAVAGGNGKLPHMIYEAQYFMDPGDDYSAMGRYATSGGSHGASGDDAGNRYYDSVLGRGTTSPDGTMWWDSSNTPHLTGWFEALSGNGALYFGLNEQPWQSRDGCIAYWEEQRNNYIIEHTAEGTVASAGAGFSTAGWPGAILAGVMGFGGSLTYSAFTAPRPSEQCPE
jgi:hypothetical protein